MKIIGKTDNGFILEANHNEVALLCGFRNQYDNDFRSLTLGIGSELQLQKMAVTSEFLRNLDTARLKIIKEKMEEAIKGIDESQENIRAVTVFEVLKEDQ